MKLNKNLSLLHFTVFIWGFTAILGSLISIHALELVWYRMLIAGISLFIYLKISNKSLRINQTTFLRLFGIGCIVALHWVLFYYTIKISTISVALVTLSATALFISLLNPLINQSRLYKTDVIIGLVIIAGIYLIYHFESQYSIGILTGLLSSLTAAVFTLINEKQVKNRDAVTISAYQMLGGFMLLSAYLFVSSFFQKLNLAITINDLIYLLLLGVICTAFAYVSGVKVMKEISAYTVALITNLEPVYGICLAFLIFGNKEKMTGGFYAGAAVILTAVFIHPVLKKKLPKLRKSKNGLEAPLKKT